MELQGNKGSPGATVTKGKKVRRGDRVIDWKIEPKKEKTMMREIRDLGTVRLPPGWRGYREKKKGGRKK